MIIKCEDSHLRSALDSMILSASGWRKVFAPGGENSRAVEPAATDCLLAVGMGLVWGEWLKDRLGRSDVVVLTATDTRPTGPVLVDMLIRGLASVGCRIIYIGVAASPEVMARCKTDKSIDAFAYISASHNPLGYNGVKFGMGGGVIGGEDARDLIAWYRGLIAEDAVANRLEKIAGNSITLAVPDVAEKHLALTAYKDFLNLIAGGPGDENNRRNVMKFLKAALLSNPVTILADLNGSARCLSADRSYFEDLGVTLLSFNDKAGEMAHTILPEGDALEPCRLALEKTHAKNSSALMGYVPDNDGDRGNLVIWDDGINAARALEAQEVFALATLAEFSTGRREESKNPSGGHPKLALVINGPTSHRVRMIAEAYGAEVHEVEVGEVHVVTRATELRRKGYQVRLMGEGSNGGTIIHPAEVRDPLNSVTSLLKLLVMPGAFRDWCQRIGKPELFREGFGPADILATIPVFTTTPSSTERSMVTISTSDHGALKAQWEIIFQNQWKKKSATLSAKYGFESWFETNTEGTHCRKGVGPEMRNGAQSGGLKIVFLNKKGQDAGFIWMRGSRTEPVFRILAEIRGNRPEAERELVSWQHEMVREADRYVIQQ